MAREPSGRRGDARRRILGGQNRGPLGRDGTGRLTGAQLAAVSRPAAVDRRLAANALWLLASQVAVLIAGLMAVVTVSRLLGPDDLGRWRFAQATAGYVVVLADAGLSTFAIREIAKGSRRASELGWSVIAIRSALTGLLWVGLVILLAATGSAADLRGPTILYALTALPIALNAQYVMQGLEDMGGVSGLRAISQLLAGSSAVILALATRNLLAVILPFVVFPAGAALVTIRWARTKGALTEPRLSRVHLVGLLRGGLPFLGAAVAVQVLFSADALVIQVFRGAAELGLYAGPYALASYLMVLGGTLVQAAFPRIASHGDSEAAFATLLKQMSELMGSLGLPLAVGGVLVADQLVGALFGPAYAGEGLVFTLLLAFPLLGFLNMTMGQALTARGGERQALVVAAGSAALNLGLNLLLIPSLGREAAAVTVVASELSSVGLYGVFLRPGPWTASVRGYLSATPQTLVMAACVAVVRLAGAPAAVSIMTGLLAYVIVNLRYPSRGMRTLREVLPIALRPSVAAGGPDS